MCHLHIRTNVNNNSIGSFTYNGSSDSNSWPINTWIRITATATTPSNENGIYLSNYVGSQVGDKIWYYGYQIEQKDHSTPYTPTSRGTTVATGGGLIDLSNNGNHGELINGVLYDSDNCGSLVFDGVDDYINILHTNQFIYGTNPFTIQLFTKLSGNNTYYPIISKGFYNGSNYQGFTLHGPYCNRIEGGDDGTNHFDYSFNVSFAREQWNNIVIVYTGTQFIYYKNAIQLDTFNWIYGVGTYNADFKIGSFWGGKFNGQISEVKFYNRTLSQSEITQIYNSTKSRYL